MTESMRKVLKQRRYIEIEQLCKEIHEPGYDIIFMFVNSPKYPNISNLKY